jgi:flavin-dependent dehydrogenase
MRFDAIVVGAGPAGTTAARLLAASGWTIALVEKDAFPRRKVCGEFISAPTHAVLKTCGIGAPFHALAGPMVTRIALFAGDDAVTAPQEKEWGRALGREHLDLLLRDAAVAAGARLFQPAELVTVQSAPRDHVCVLDDGRCLETAILVGATGSWRIKPPFAVASAERASDLLAFKAHFAQSALPTGDMPLLAFPGGYGGLVHTDSGRTSLSCCIRREALAALRQPGERAGETVLRHILATTRGAHRALTGCVPEGAILSAGPIRPGIRPRYKDGVFFTGNLAGEAHPIIAEGISMAIQSSWLLARHLITAGCGAHPDRTGVRYAADWRRRFGLRLMAASAFSQMAQHAPGLGAALVKVAPSLLTWGAQMSGKVQTLQ